MDNTAIIGIKQLHSELSSIHDRFLQVKEIIVVKNSKPIFKIMPLSANNPKKKYTLSDFAKCQFHSGEKNLSKNIDNIIYS
ncbi:hypothetical protein A2335_03555 [Candidatus Peregrinibacteria bacterium RIFOXYB2_FULL_32_7]|nr:MAG: hypothetical protein A2335_03555 [Candidatus Peregrinibacteria bacterium RIFOXYB2_FULL_32_7]